MKFAKKFINTIELSSINLNYCNFDKSGKLFYK